MMPPLVIGLSDLSPAQLARHGDAFAVALRAQMAELLAEIQLAAMAAAINVRRAEENRLDALFRVLLALAESHAEHVIEGRSTVFEDLAVTSLVPFILSATLGAANLPWNVEARRVADRLARRVGREPGHVPDPNDDPPGAAA
jgi:hypothetical protein